MRGEVRPGRREGVGRRRRIGGASGVCAGRARLEAALGAGHGKERTWNMLAMVAGAYGA